MTPMDKVKLKNERQIRALQVFAPAETKRIDSNYYVEGYAARYEPYVLYEMDDGPIYERFERGCFDNCDMSDVIFQLNHQGTVMARQSNGSLIVEPDEIGLFTAADLGRTEAARRLYEEISTEKSITLTNSRRLLRKKHVVQKSSLALRHACVLVGTCGLKLIAPVSTLLLLNVLNCIKHT